LDTNRLFMLSEKHLKTLLLLLLWINFFQWIQCEAVHGQTTGTSSWKRLDTRYTIIQYQTSKDLAKFNRKIDFSSEEWGVKSLFSGSGSKDPVGATQKKVDAVFARVQEILDMRKRVKKVIINIYPRQLFHKIRYRITGSKRPIRSWYIFNLNTIYINADDVNEGILAHELAHAIIDHYMTVRPPRATAEILARYVDEHLHY